MSIAQFKETVKARGLARSNRFIIEFGLPQLIQKDTLNLQTVHLLCESVSLPSINIASQPNRSYGEQREIPYDRNFEPMTVNFYVDSEMVVKEFFDYWVNVVINPVSRSINYYSQYTTDMSVYVLDVADTKTYQVKMFEVYPKTVSAISLDQNSRDIMKLSVTFNYRYHLSSRMVVLNGEPNIQNQFNIDKARSYYEQILPPTYFNAGTSLSSVPDEYLTTEISTLESRANTAALSRVFPTLNSSNPLGVDTLGGDFWVGGP